MVLFKVGSSIHMLSMCLTNDFPKKQPGQKQCFEGYNMHIHISLNSLSQPRQVNESLVNSVRVLLLFSLQTEHAPYLMG